ncbi:hypothetical protein ACFE04_006557 [Oxalis oulophora]
MEDSESKSTEAVYLHVTKDVVNKMQQTVQSFHSSSAFDVRKSDLAEIFDVIRVETCLISIPAFMGTTWKSKLAQSSRSMQSANEMMIQWMKTKQSGILLPDEQGESVTEAGPSTIIDQGEDYILQLDRAAHVVKAEGEFLFKLCWKFTKLVAVGIMQFLVNTTTLDLEETSGKLDF